MKEGSERVEKLIGREGIGKQQSGQLATGIGWMELEKYKSNNGGENHIEDRLESEGGIWRFWV